MCRLVITRTTQSQWQLPGTPQTSVCLCMPSLQMSTCFTKPRPGLLVCMAQLIRPRLCGGSSSSASPRCKLSTAPSSENYSLPSRLPRLLGVELRLLWPGLLAAGARTWPRKRRARWALTCRLGQRMTARMQSCAQLGSKRLTRSDDSAKQSVRLPQRSWRGNGALLAGQRCCLLASNCPCRAQPASHAACCGA